MKVIILAGGFGTRISEYTEDIPKPLIKIGEHPILWHIMKIYSQFNFDDFYIACGYKAHLIKDYFLKYASLSEDFTIDLSSGKTNALGSKVIENWKVTLVDTGLNTMTGGRIKRMKDFIGDDEFFLFTYGDGLSNINISELLDFHKKHKKMITVSAVRPTARFGELTLEGNLVSSFLEKPQLNQGWINGGFFVANSEFFDLIDGDEIMLERQPLEAAAKMGELVAYKHEGFWQCMDTKRDHQSLQKLWKEDLAPWKKI